MPATVAVPPPAPADPIAPSEPAAPALSTTALEAELLGLAGHLAAAQCRFLRLLAEFDRRAGWAGPGLRSCAHWLNWRAGMSLRTAVEQVRVAHALTALPRITAAFAAGRLSYSKVRALTRVTGPDTTPEQEQTLLDLALAGTASHVERVVRAARRRGAEPAVAAAERTLSWHWADDGTLVLRGRLPAAEGAALIAAIEARTGPPRQPVTHPVPAPPPDWQAGGAERQPGAAVDRLAARRADALLALVDTAVHGGGATDRGTDPGAPGERPTIVRGDTRVVVHLDAATGLARLDGGPEIPGATVDRLACDARVQVLLSDRRRNRLYLGRSRRLASPAQIAALTVRDEARCQFAGCTAAHHLHAHHVRPWRRGGRTDIDNLVLLCGFHHRLLHDLGYRLRRAAGRWHTERPDGTPVPETGAPLDGNTESLHEIHTRAGLAITARSLTPTWAGEPLDPDPILQRLLPPPAAAA